MPSDRYLHPTSILFGMGKGLREFAFPLLLVIVGASSTNRSWEIFLLPLFIPYLGAILLRYFTFRYHYEPSELVIRTGLFFRNERHIPYHRIQNIDAVQNVFHRLLRVVEVRVETGGGAETEAKMSVLPLSAYDEMRRHVFERRASGEQPASGDLTDSAHPPAGAVLSEADRNALSRETPTAQPPILGASPQPERLLLQLPARELLLQGFIDSRVGVAFAAAFGLAWELDLPDRISGLFQLNQKQLGSRVVNWLYTESYISPTRIVLGFVFLLGILLVLRSLSMVWALVRMYGFRLTCTGQDLRTQQGLLTRVVTTIPLHRIQTLTVLEGPWHRLFGRISIQVETAGGSASNSGMPADTSLRALLAPLLRKQARDALLAQLLPGWSSATLDWNPPAPGAFRRAAKKSMLLTGLIALPVFPFSVVGGLVALVLLEALAILHAHRSIRHQAWAVSGENLLFRQGWLWRRIRVAPFAKLQTVAFHQSPFDRRAGMAQVAVDTAGAASGRLHIPYLTVDKADRLSAFLAEKAARTAFRW